MSSTVFLPGADQPDENQGPAILGATIITTVLALATVCARLWVRVTIVRATGWDDYVMLLAMAMTISGMGVVIPEVLYGAGRHAAYLDPARASIGLKLNFITQPIFLWAITTVKISIALFLLRIAPTPFYRRILWGIIVFLIVYTFASMMTILLQCTNIAVLWDSTVTATCWSMKTIQSLSYTNSTLNILTDLTFAILPVPMLWNVQINSRVKTSLFCIMSLGVFACAAAIVKATYITNYGKTGDFLWDSADLTIWTVTECNTGTIAACLPCLKPLFKRILESSWGSRGRTKNSNSQSHNLSNLHNSGLNSKSRHKSQIVSRTSKITMGHKIQIHSGIEDNISEESILPIQGTGDEIRKTTVVTVDRSESAGKADRERWERERAKGGEMEPEWKFDDRV